MLRPSPAVIALILCCLGAEQTAAKTKEPPPVPLPSTHVNAARTVRFRTPADWTVESRPGDPEVTEARGGVLLVRILRRGGEAGLDGLHVDCMQARLAGAMDTQPMVDYEYDFVGGAVGERQLLDSAFVVHYDGEVAGSRDWRQRNITVVGGGESLCVIGYAPAPQWKKSKDLRRLLDAVLGSVEMQPWR